MPPSRMIRALAIAFGTAAAAGAAQLGIGYGLGVFSWLPTVAGSDEASWLASLAWTVWISATSVLIGSVVAARVCPPDVGLSAVATLLWRSSLVVTASLGGLIVAGLTAVPSQVAQRADTFAPQMIVGFYAIAGIILGLAIALVAVNFPAVSTNLLATTGWLWLLAAVATVDGLAAGRDLGVSQLGVWQVTTYGPWFQSIYLPGAVLAAGAAVVIGALTAWPQARQGANKIGVALSGAAGPAVVAGAYLLAAPVLKSVRPDQLSAHLVAPYAVLAGLIGSVAVALLAGAGRRGLGRGDADNDQAGRVSVPQPQVARDPV